MQRRPLDPLLSWPSAGPSVRYRVSVRNEDTGERRAVHDGTQTVCRLPADLRSSPDQLTFRVSARDPDPRKRSIVQRPFAIDRVGDDFTTPAPDLLTIPEQGAPYYRLHIVDTDSGERVVDMCRADPAFLLPAGQLKGRKTTWRITAGEDPGHQRRARWSAVTLEMIAAAEERATREVAAPAQVARRPVTAPARTAPGRASAIAAMAGEVTGAVFAPIVTMTIDPLLSDGPEVSGMLRQQWGGTGPVAAVATALDRARLPGVFMLDVFAAEHLDLDLATRLIGKRFADSRVELFFNPGRWLQAAGEAIDPASPGAFQALLSRARELFQQIVGRQPVAVRLADDLATEANLAELDAAGFKLVVLGSRALPQLPSWMQERQAPFVAGRQLVVAPVSTLVSQPAHPRDRPLRHDLGLDRPLVAALAGDLAGVAAKASERSPTLLLTEIDPLALLRTERVSDAEKARAWNKVLTRKRPGWVDLGWERSERAYDIGGDLDDAAVERLEGLLRGIARSGVGPAPAEALFRPDFLRAISELRRFEPFLELRRGPRSARVSAVRLYGAALRQALSVEAS